MVRRQAFFAILLGATILAACSGGGGGVTPAGGPARTGNAHLTIVIPQTLNAGTVRAPKYISPATKSISISVNAGTPVIADLTPGSPDCPVGNTTTVRHGASAALTCTIDVTAPIATDTFLLKLYDGLHATGNVLATTTVTRTIAGSTPITISMNGVAHTVVISLGNASPLVGSAVTIPVYVTVEDPSGAVITGEGNYDAPIALTDSDTSGHTHLSSASIAGPGNAVTLSFDGSSSVSSATISATVAGNIASVTPAVLRPANAQNGGGGVAVVSVGGNTYAEIPSASGLIQVRLTTNGVLATTPPSPNPSSSASPLPTPPANSTLLPIAGGIDACALGQVSSSVKMFCVNVDTQNAPVNVIDLTSGTPVLSSSFATDATSELGFSGGSCYVCGLTWDAHDNAVLISTGNTKNAQTGFYSCEVGEFCPGSFELYSTAGTRTGSVSVGDVPENFGYNATTNQIFSASYNEIGLVDLTSGIAYQSTDQAFQRQEIDSGAVDPVTNVAVGIDEFDGNAYIAPLNSAVLATPQPESTQYTFSNPLLSVTPVTADIIDFGNNCLPDAITIDSTSHTAFLSGEYSGPNCVSAVKLPTSSPTAPFTPVQFMGIANMPNTPDGNEFYSALDPHVAASFYLSGSDLYGLVYNYDRSWVAVVDITKLLAAPGLACDSHIVDTNYDLIGNGVLSYIPTGYSPGPASNGETKRRLRTHAKPPFHRMTCYS